MVVSLDFELMWGLYDSRHATAAQVSALGARRAIPLMLDAFRRSDVRVTWATVGMLLVEGRQQLQARLDALCSPDDEQDRALLAYVDAVVGQGAEPDPLHFAGDLIERILEVPGQEIASHSFSHYCAAEPNSNRQRFVDDVRSSIDVASQHDLTLLSLVFPRNQIDPQVLPELALLGFRGYRGNPDHVLYRSRSADEQSRWLRAGRMFDALVPIAGTLSGDPVHQSALPTELVASRFLRPWTPAMSTLYDLHLLRIRREMTAAACSGRYYHLWWHPHNFGLYTERQLAALAELLRHFEQLRDRYNWPSMNMADCVNTD